MRTSFAPCLNCLLFSLLACLAICTIFPLDSSPDKTCSFNSLRYPPNTSTFSLQSILKPLSTCDRPHRQLIARPFFALSSCATFSFWRSSHRTLLATKCSLCSFELKISNILPPLLRAFLKIYLKITSICMRLLATPLPAPDSTQGSPSTSPLTSSEIQETTCRTRTQPVHPTPSSDSRHHAAGQRRGTHTDIYHLGKRHPLEKREKGACTCWVGVTIGDATSNVRD